MNFSSSWLHDLWDKLLSKQLLGKLSNIYFIYFLAVAGPWNDGEAMLIDTCTCMNLELRSRVVKFEDVYRRQVSVHIFITKCCMLLKGVFHYLLYKIPPSIYFEHGGSNAKFHIKPWHESWYFCVVTVLYVQMTHQDVARRSFSHLHSWNIPLHQLIQDVCYSILWLRSNL
jgi:hypothetical protein